MSKIDSTTAPALRADQADVYRQRRSSRSTREDELAARIQNRLDSDLGRLREKVAEAATPTAESTAGKKTGLLLDIEA